MNKFKRKRRLLAGDDLDPMSVIGNLFDVAMVFSVALMVALVSYLDVAEMLFADKFTMVKNPGTEDMEIITKEDGELVRYKATEADSASQSGKGRRVGTAFQLDSGEIIYIPE